MFGRYRCVSVKKHLKFEDIPAYGAAHKLEHLKRGKISGIPLWTFEYIKEPI
jgi:predicted metalloprotease